MSNKVGGGSGSLFRDVSHVVVIIKLSPDIWLEVRPWMTFVSPAQGHNNQDGEADGRAGGHWHRHSSLAALQAEDYEPVPAGEWGSLYD